MGLVPTPFRLRQNPSLTRLRHVVNAHAIRVPSNSAKAGTLAAILSIAGSAVSSILLSAQGLAPQSAALRIPSFVHGAHGGGSRWLRRSAARKRAKRPAALGRCLQSPPYWHRVNKVESRSCRRVFVGPRPCTWCPSARFNPDHALAWMRIIHRQLHHGRALADDLMGATCTARDPTREPGGNRRWI